MGDTVRPWELIISTYGMTLPAPLTHFPSPLEVSRPNSPDQTKLSSSTSITSVEVIRAGQLELIIYKIYNCTRCQVSVSDHCLGDRRVTINCVIKHSPDDFMLLKRCTICPCVGTLCVNIASSTSWTRLPTFTDVTSILKHSLLSWLFSC